MDKKINDSTKIDQALNNLKEDLSKLFDKEVIASHDSGCKVLTTIDNKTCLIVSTNEYKSNAYKVYSESKSSHKLCIIIFDKLDKDPYSQHNPNNIPTLYVSNFDDSSYWDKAKIYFDLVSKEVPTFEQVQSETIECIKLDHINNNCLKAHIIRSAEIWTKYIIFNKICKTWSNHELDQAWWEKNILDADMVPQKNSTINKSDKSERDTFKSIISLYTSEGKTNNYPDLEELLKSEGLDTYVFNRYKEIDVSYVKRRFLEFLLFLSMKKKSDKFKKPEMLKELLNLIEQEILDFKKVNSNLIDLDISRSIHRYIEIINIYYKAFENNQDFLNNKIAFLQTHIKNLIDDKKFRWLIDTAKYLMMYKKVTKGYFENEIELLIQQLELGKKAFKISKDTILQESCIQMIKSLKEYKGVEYNVGDKLAQIKYEYANQAVLQGSYLQATFLLRDGLKILEKTNVKGIYSEKIQNWSKILKKWSLLAKKELKPIPKAPISLELMKQVETANDNFIIQLKKLSLKDRIPIFFMHNKHFIDENNFLKSYKDHYKTRIISHFECTQFVDNINIVAPKNNEEQIEQKEFMYYSVVIECYVRNFTSLFDKAIGKLFTLNDLIDYLNNSKTVNIDDLKFIKCGLELFNSKQYAASVHILLPTIERFFRMFIENMGKGLKYKSGGGLENNASLDTMIKDSVEGGFPKGAARLFRFFISNKFGYNLRNSVLHSEHNFETVDYRKNAILVIWCVLYCYVNLKKVD